MNYHYWDRYIKFIEYLDSQTFEGFTQTHHIMPCSLHGDDCKDNLINIGLREHFICHWLLYLAIPCKETFYALHAMKGHYKNKSSWNYALGQSTKNYSLSRDTTIRRWIHKNGVEFTGTNYDFSQKYGLESSHIVNVCSPTTINKSVKGWHLVKGEEYTFQHKESGEIFKGTNKEFAFIKGLKLGDVNKLINPHKSNKTVKGWYLI